MPQISPATEHFADIVKLFVVGESTCVGAPSEVQAGVLKEDVGRAWEANVILSEVTSGRIDVSYYFIEFSTAFSLSYPTIAYGLL